MPICKGQLLGLRIPHDSHEFFSLVRDAGDMRRRVEVEVEVEGKRAISDVA
jgi:hypothetical protein